MTRSDDFIGQLEAYLEEYEGSTPLPEHVRGAIRAELPSTHQRRSWWPTRRFPEMNSIMKLSLAAAAVVLAAFIGYNYVVAPTIGGPRLGDPSPTPTPLPLNGLSRLSAGRYQGIVPGGSGLGFTVSVPEGWDAIANLGVAAPHDDSDQAHAMIFWNVSNLYADPLNPDAGELDPPVGPSVDDLVSGLTSHDGWTTSSPTDVTVGGYPGKLVELTVPPDADFEGCGATGSTSRPFAVWTEGAGSWRCMQGPGQTDHVYIVDVEGVRVVITLLGYPEWDGQYLDTLRAVVDSIEFVSP